LEGYSKAGGSVKTMDIPELSVEDARDFVISLLKSGQGQSSLYTGYQIDVSWMLECYIQEMTDQNRQSIEQISNGRNLYKQCTGKLSPVFLVATWELCLSGIFRPSRMSLVENPHQLTAHADPFCCEAFTVTPYGKEWLARIEADYIPSTSGKFIELVKEYQARFISAYIQRAEEAFHCYKARCNLACCVMCGAASESILLAVGFARDGDEDTLKTYLGRSGRKELTDKVIGKTPTYKGKKFREFIEQLSPWRDESAHGTAIEISESEAFLSLITLLHSQQVCQ
jgi:hypothetical protein